MSFFVYKSICFHKSFKYFIWKTDKPYWIYPVFSSDISFVRKFKVVSNFNEILCQIKLKWYLFLLYIFLFLLSFLSSLRWSPTFCPDWGHWGYLRSLKSLPPWFMGFSYCSLPSNWAVVIICAQQHVWLTFGFLVKTVFWEPWSHKVLKLQACATTPIFDSILLISHTSSTKRIAMFRSYK